MAKDLKKFVNPLFLKTVSLELLRRLLERHRDDLNGFDMASFDRQPELVREKIIEFLKGPEDGFPKGLVIDLHQIADLGTREGLDLLIQRARRACVQIVPAGANLLRQDPKHVALAAFLDHPEVFAVAHSVMAYYFSVGIYEIVGKEDGLEPDLDDTALFNFKSAVGSLFETYLRGDYCEVETHEDDGDVVLAVFHGAPMRTISIIEDRAERLIPLRETEQAVLSYTADDARLKMYGVATARRTALAEIFATHILQRPGFFARLDAENLYTLAPIERDWPAFSMTHAFDPSIRRIRITEAQVDRIACDLFGEFDHVEWSLVARDSHHCALARLHEAHPEIHFGSGDWRISHIVARVQIDSGGRRPSTVTVKIRPETTASFKRHRFEAQIMQLLRRNGFCRDRDPDRTPVAAE